MIFFLKATVWRLFVKGAAGHGITKWQLFLPYRQLCFHIGWTKFLFYSIFEINIENLSKRIENVFLILKQC